MPSTTATQGWGGYAKALLATLFWGCSFIAIRYALGTASPFGIVWMRNALAAALLFAILRLRGQPLFPEPADRGRVILLGLLFGGHLLVQTWAIERTSTIRAGWIIAFIPAVVAIGAWLFQKQRLQAIGWLGILVASAGVFVLTATRPAQFAEAGTGDLLMLVTTFSWAAYTLLSAGPARRSGGLRVSATALLVSIVPNLIVALFTGSWHATPDGPSLTALLFLGLGASGIAMWAYTDAIADLGPERSAAFQYLQPMVTMGAAYVLLNEPVTSDQLIGGPIVLAGVWLVQRGKRNG
ncbi:MAG: DMT family transporter [Flavobacteriales bacterium]